MGKFCDSGEEEIDVWQVLGTKSAQSVLSKWKSPFPSWTWEMKSARDSLSVGTSEFPQQKPQHREKAVHSARSSGQGFRAGGHLLPTPLARLGVTRAQGRAEDNKQ